jgi:SAM-dependent methyltransferase
VTPSIHPTAGEGFEAAATTYERSRPGYPTEAVAWLARELRIGPGAEVLDLGAGTGKLTEALVETGAEVVAVEPVEAMRTILAGKLPHVRSLAGTAEAIPLPDGSTDAVAVAQAFHWFGAAEALAEIHRVLRPGGALGVVFNVRDESVGWQARLTELLRPLEADAPRHRHGVWRAAIDASELFVGARAASFRYRPTTDAEGVLGRVASMSFVAAAPEHERGRLLDRVRTLLETDPDTAGRDRFAFPYRTECLAVDRAERAVRGRPRP